MARHPFAIATALLAALAAVRGAAVPAEAAASPRIAELDATTAAANATAQRLTALTAAQIATFRPYGWFSNTAYCNPKTTINWSCGSNCQKNPGFKPVAAGGDGVLTQFWYVGYDPTLKEVILSHQGTDPDKIIPALTDIDIVFDPLNKQMFPGAPSGVKTHSGFGGSQFRSAPGVLAAVKSALATYGASKVTVTGHSLGGAIGLISAVYLQRQLPATVAIEFIGFGIPRVGNDAFVAWVSSLPLKTTRVNSRKDPVPILPGRGLGYRHVAGEIHISERDARWLVCPGLDNTGADCTIATVPNIFVGNVADHDGPYGEVAMTGC